MPPKNSFHLVEICKKVKLSLLVLIINLYSFQLISSQTWTSIIITEQTREEEVLIH